MGIVQWVALLIFAVAILGGAIIHGSRWNASPDDPVYSVPDGWPWKEGTWYLWRRTLVPLVLSGVAIGAGAVAPERWVVGVAVVFFGVALPLFVSIALFNRPRLLVPPGLRDRPGLIARRRWVASGRGRVRTASVTGVCHFTSETRPGGH